VTLTKSALSPRRGLGWLAGLSGSDLRTLAGLRGINVIMKYCFVIMKYCFIYRTSEIPFAAGGMPVSVRFRMEDAGRKSAFNAVRGLC
jgi:hypothetical protein